MTAHNLNARDSTQDVEEDAGAIQDTPVNLNGKGDQVDSKGEPRMRREGATGARDRSVLDREDRDNVSKSETMTTAMMVLP